MIKQLFVDVPQDGVMLGLGCPCPCNEGHVTWMDLGARTFGHTLIGRIGTTVVHRMPQVAYKITVNRI